ncbi:MAG: hypothetical protein PHU25_00685 [Deltaproteobacteria bacterium]|nr:hypothetical protein [Deltaproteobacteria bacterium]
MHRHVLVSIATSLLAVGACGSGDVGSAGDDDSPIGESPTGTTLEPVDGTGSGGYVAVDETCEKTDSSDYLARFSTPMFRDAVVSGDVAYLVDGNMLWILSIFDASEPERLSLLRLPGRPLSIALGPGDRLLVAAGDEGLLVVDAANPAAPKVVADLPLPGTALGVAVEGSVAYAALGDAGLAVVDVSDPLAPVLAGIVNVPGFAVSVDVDGQTAYVAACASLNIVDVSEPDAPTLVAAYWVPEGHAKSVFAAGTDVFVAGGEALFAFDASDPAAVLWTGYYAEPGTPGFYVNAVEVRDDVAYIAAGDESVRSIDLTRLSQTSTYLPPAEGDGPPDLDGPLNAPEANMDPIDSVSGDPINVHLAGNLLLVLGNFRWVGERLVRILSVPLPGEMFEVGSYVQPNDTLGLAPLGADMVVHGSDGRESLVSANGTAIDTFSLPSDVRKSAEMGGRLYMLLDNGQVFRYSSGSLETVITGNIYDIALNDPTGYAADFSDNALYAFRPGASDGATKLGTYIDDDAFLGYARLLHANGRVLAYDWALGDLHVIDFRNEGAPMPVSVTPLGLCEAYDIADFYSGRKLVRSRLAPAGDDAVLLCPCDEEGLSSLRFLDLSDPAHPVVSKEYGLPEGRYVDAVVKDNKVYALMFDNNAYRSALARLEGGKWVMRLFDGHANGMWVGDGTVVVADGDVGLRWFGETADGFKEYLPMDL